MIETKESLVGEILQEQEIVGEINKGKETTQPILQQKEATPTENIQEIIPDNGYDGLSKVIVNPIPSEYVIPSEYLERSW